MIITPDAGTPQSQSSNALNQGQGFRLIFPFLHCSSSLLRMRKFDLKDMQCMPDHTYSQMDRRPNKRPRLAWDISHTPKVRRFLFFFLLFFFLVRGKGWLNFSISQRSLRKLGILFLKKFLALTATAIMDPSLSVVVVASAFQMKFFELDVKYFN